MNILFLHSASDLYGSGKILIDVLKIATQKGHKCWVILPEEGDLNEHFTNLGVNVIIKEIGIIRRKYLSPLGLLNRFIAVFLSLFELSKFIKKHDIVLVYSNTTAIFSGALIAKILGLKHIWHVHEILLTPKIFVNLLAILLDRFSNYCIVVSKAVEKHWRNLGVKASKIKTIYNGIEAKEFELKKGMLREELKINNDITIIGMIARVHFHKGQDYFLEIAGKLINKHENLKFVMVGDVFPGYEYLYDKLEEIKKKYNLEKSVFDLGFRKDIPNILAGFDIFILPSILPDSLPTTVLEAMAAGKVVIATNYGGAQEMVDDGKTGFLIPYDDPEKASKVILELLQNKEKIREMGEEGRKRVKEYFSPTAFEDNITELLNEVKKTI